MMLNDDQQREFDLRIGLIGNPLFREQLEAAFLAGWQARAARK